MSLSELSPYPVSIVLDGNALELRYFDARAITWADATWEGGTDEMNAVLDRGPGNREPEIWLIYSNTVLDIAYQLIKYPDDYGYASPCLFKTVVKNLNKTEEDSETERFVAICHEALRHIFAVSFKTAEPETKGGEIYKRTIAQQPEPEPTNWAKIYADFLPMSLDDFFKLTLKQIQDIHDEIINTKNADLKVYAGFHGVKMNGVSQTKPGTSNFSDEEIEALQADIKDFESQFIS